MNKKREKNDRLDREYTHPEFLKEFFPNIDLSEQGEPVLTEDPSLDIPTDIISTSPLPCDGVKP